MAAVSGLVGVAISGFSRDLPDYQQLTHHQPAIMTGCTRVTAAFLPNSPPSGEYLYRLTRFQNGSSAHLCRQRIETFTTITGSIPSSPSTRFLKSPAALVVHGSRSRWRSPGDCWLTRSSAGCVGALCWLLPDQGAAKRERTAPRSEATAAAQGGLGGPQCSADAISIGLRQTQPATAKLGAANSSEAEV
jgi:hypothetical protein